jgi:hypothetical protein
MSISARADLVWKMEAPAVKLADKLASETHQLPTLIMRLDEDTASLVIELDGVDYILTMSRVPVQRVRAAKN